MSSNGSSTSTYQPLIPSQNQYPVILYVICPICIIYFGIYVLLRNHYVFKPQVIRYLKQTKIKSIVLNQLIIDVVSSLSIFTFTLSSILLSYSDRAITLILHQDLYWQGLCMALIVYRNIKETQILQIKVVIKNGLFLIFMYVMIIEQYFSLYSFLLMGLVMVGLYICNLLLKIYQQQFVKMVEVLFNSKPHIISQIPYNNTNQMPSLEYLSTHFPVSRQELQAKLHTFQPKLKKIKLKTKTAVTKKLLLLSLAVRLSQQKMVSKMKKQVASYYGGLNGTTNEKIKRINHEDYHTYQQETKLIHDQKGQYGNGKRRSNQERNWSDEHRRIDYNLKHTHSFEENLAKTSKTQEDFTIQTLDVDDQLQVLFTIFPIKVFESSKIISTAFTLLINLALGFCLDYSLTILQTLKYGGYFHYLFALVILPVLPHVSKNQYFNSMTLASIWKYTLIGLFVAINVAVNGSAYLNYQNGLKIQAIFNIIMVVFVMVQLLSNSNNVFKLFLTFFLLLLANIALTYTSSQT